MRGFQDTWKRWKSGKTVHYDALQDPLYMCLERTQDLRKRLGVHTIVSKMQVRRLLWAKKWLREETYPEDERTDAGEAMRAMVLGRLPFEKVQAPPSRFVSFSRQKEEGDRAVEDARTAAGVLGIDLPREKPSRDQKWWEWLLVVPTTNIRKLLSNDTRAGLWLGVPSEILTCEKCGARVRGEVK